MHTVGSLTWKIIFSLTLMSQLYKEFSCESIVHKIDKGLTQQFDEKQLPDTTTRDSDQRKLIELGIRQRPFTNVLIPGQDKSERVGDDVPQWKLESMSALFQMSKEEILSDAPFERKRRHSAGQQSTISECQRLSMYVNFTTIGWNTWIISPPGYNAYYCAGECPLQLVDFNSTKHAQIQGFMSRINPTIPKPCCVPTKLSLLILSYIVNGTTHLDRYGSGKVWVSVSK